MKKLSFLLLLVPLLQIGVPPAALAQTPAPSQTPGACTLCVGQLGGDGVVAPALVRLDESNYATYAAANAANVAVVIDYKAANVDDVEQKTKAIVDWAKAHGPFDAIGVHIDSTDPALVAYATKRLSVMAQGQQAAQRILFDNRNAMYANVSMELHDHSELIDAFESGAGSYFDAVVVYAQYVPITLATLAEHDPSKKIYAVTALQSPNPLFDLAQALAAGASRAYASGPADARALAQFNRTMTGDWAFDSTSKTAVLDAKGNSIDMPVLTFVRGEDLRTLLVARGDAASASILALPGERYTTPRRIDAAGERAITDTGQKNGRLLVGTPATTAPYAVLVEHAEKPEHNVTKESISVATQRGISVEEIIRNHQAYRAYQDTLVPRTIARNTTKLRFDIGSGADAIEATIAGDYFSDPHGSSDWVWQDFYINGVKWKYGRIPELPLIQPEKVAQLPLDIHLTNDYRYELVRETELNGYHVYEVRFEPPPNAPADLPLYRGTVFIDARTWARIRVATVQLHLTGEVLSNEERVDFAPFASVTHEPLSAADVAKSDPRLIVWLPSDVHAQQVISAAGRASVVERATDFTNYRLDPPEYDRLHAEASASEARMVRETPEGMRYLEKRGDGTREVKEGFDTSRLFMLGGIHHDAGLDYPVVPLGGIDYFNFNLLNRGIQTNVFFAGVIVAANATDPNVGNTRTNVGADFFGLAVPFQNTMFRNGEEQPSEAVKTLPASLTLRAGHPVFGFGKIDASLGIAHFTYQRAEDTAADFVIPSDTFVFSPSVSAQYARHGYSASAYYDYNRRSEWEPWGAPGISEYDPAQKSFAHFGASIGKSFYLPKFQRIGVDVNYLDGTRLDRFSKYELGFFGAQRVHGVESGSVRAERAILGHLSYGFVFSEQFRMEAFYDHAVVDDASAGLRREPFQGLGIAGQTVGPYGTLLRLDIGKTIGRNAQDGFVANVVFLKLF
ncbi:MAG: hypothetical protein JO197_01350 [Acidobacteria bacterium]|nr:hypothetical protein [Acidobacteriota bacterium]MBV9476239.1 hypothetical protein [Acidobacteriota bacterium]